MRSAALVILLAAAPAPPPPAPTPATVAAIPAEELRGRAAELPFVEHEAENGRTNGIVIGPDRTFTTLAAEASGRRAVRLEGRGRFVEFVLGRPANAVTVRYAIPDGPDGNGIDSTLGVHAEGRRIATLALTSRYGWFYGDYPFTNRPADGKPHHFYDEARLLFGRTLPAGTRVRLEAGEENRAPWYIIDLADFELVPPPRAAPPGAIAVTRFGADPSGGRESSRALEAAIAAARRRGVPVWIPSGTYRLERHVTVDRVTIEGAGPWHSVLRGRGAGLYGRKAPGGSTAVTLRGFAILGEVTERDDKAALAGIGGAMGGGSLLEDLWIQHHKVGLWFDGPMDGIRIRRLRILDNTADGLNFRRGVSNAVVEDSFVRNSGDDGLAMWSHRQANRGNAFRNNIVIAPNLANGIAIYGGREIEVSGNLVADTLTQGGGIHLGNRFDAVPLAGRITLAGNTIVRGGSFDPNWRFGVGALWFYALDSAIAADIEVSDTLILDSTLPAIHFIGKPIAGIRFDGVTIRGGSHALQLQSPGTASVSRGSAAGLGAGGVLDCGSGFAIILLGGNSGWQNPARAPCRLD